MQIGPEKLLDGAMGGHNNPVALAFDEVNQMHWRHDPLMVISIGTGMKPRPETSATQKLAIPILHNIRETFQSNPHPSINLSTGRKLQRPAGGSTASQDFYEGQEWKNHPGICFVILWCVEHIDVRLYLVNSRVS